ncbi:hypothetical protein NM208_g12525 [Fusarium decemcellulare]|uniref:Uncharacterized protein n=1 Tax=Fusarium decemcellulare TaxID=57161 RepID=A0ACC1RQC2_9HYPO|nr:hypothetical protein NM208_g12525 [Fusarium decemcellulare]
MTGQSTRRWLQLSFLLMAGTASANSLTLSDFESVTSGSVSSECVAAYDTPLVQCSPNDFTGGRACSAACKDSVKAAEGLIQQSCGDASSDDESLLSRGQKGDLVAVLCRDVDEPQDAPATQPPETQPIATQAPTTTVASTLVTRPKENILIETHASSLEERTSERLNGPPLSSVNEELATKSTVLAIDTEDEPTVSMPPAPTALSTSPTKATAASHTTEPSGEAASATPTPGAGSIHAPSLGYMCASLAMSTILYMMVLN